MEGAGGSVPSTHAGGGANGPGGAIGIDQVDRVVRQRLEQAFNGVFGKLLESSERAARAAEAQAVSNKADTLVKNLKVEVWKPASREEELRSWREWYFQLSNWLVANDPAYNHELLQLWTLIARWTTSWMMLQWLGARNCSGSYVRL